MKSLLSIYNRILQGTDIKQNLSMATQSEAALENGLISTLQQMSYKYVHIDEEANLMSNFKKQLEIHNRKKLADLGRTEFSDAEFEKIQIHLEGGTRFEKAKKLRDLFPLDTDDGQRIWVEFLNRQQWCQKEYDYLQKEQPEIIQKALKEKHLGLIKTRKAPTRIMVDYIVL